jgi:hypothetical protein
MRDISDILAAWPFDPAKIQSRIAEDENGRRVVQLRIDLGVLQMEVDGRPDGERPGGYESILAQYTALEERIEERLEECGGAPDGFEIPPEDYAEVDREILQYYHRRLAFYGAGDYERAARDAEHSVELLELVREHAKNRDYVARISGMIPSVLLERARTKALISLREKDPGAAVEHVEEGVRQIQEHLRRSSSEAGDRTAKEIAFLRRWARRIRRANALGEPLEMQLQEAIQREDYREAARLRDEIKRREPGQ